MKRIVIICLVSFLASGVALGREPSPLVGAGALKCGKFASANADRLGGAEALYFSWAQGFMTAVNHDTSTSNAINGFRDLRNAEDIMGKLRIYCRAKPLASFMEAVVETMATLPIHRIR